MTVFSFFRRKRRLTEQQQFKFIDAIATMLELQLAAVGPNAMNPAIERKALGYVYGFIDAALRTVGRDMSDRSIGVPITYHVLRRLFAGREDGYIALLSDGVGKDQLMMAGVMYGGQQYIDFNNGKLAAPMGLARMHLEQGRS